MQIISGGVCAAKGFSASGIHCGVRRNKQKKDFALIVSSVPCASAGVYTQNLVKGAPILVTRQHLANGCARAVLCNSGNANTCNADGVDIANAMCALLEKHTGIAQDDVIIASTGVIGQPLSLKPFEDGMAALVAGLSENGSADANQAIMTTDTAEKSAAVEFTLGGKTCHIGGIAKGSGMIHPNMATMLCFLTSDAAITPDMVQKALDSDVKSTFNMLSIDGDTSTNDTLTLMCSGLAGNPLIDAENDDFAAFCDALHAVTSTLCRMLAKDGEGASKLVCCEVSGAETLDIARAAAKSVISSSLVKAAMFGADANCGRIMCALGYAGVPLDVNAISVSYRAKAGEIAVCERGACLSFDEKKAKDILMCDEIDILVSLGGGAFSAVAWGCDLTYDYVKINGDYRT